MRAILLSVLVVMTATAVLPGQRRRRRDMTPEKMDHFTFEVDRFDSKAVGERMPYGVYLPKGYDGDAERRYPLIIWLHGMWENHERFHGRGGALMLDKAVADGVLPPCVFVTAYGGRSSMYMNRGKERYQDLISEDLLQHACKEYRISEKRSERALMGVSMGGMGALRIAFTNPDLFGAVAVHSSAVFAKDPEDMPDRLKEFAGRLGFGNPIDKKIWQKVNPTCIADTVDTKALKGLRIYFDAGSRDRYGFQHGNKLLHETLEKQKVPHKWRLIDGGGHSWGNNFQTRTLPHSFAFVGKMFRGETAGDQADKKPAKEGESGGNDGGNDQNG